MTEAAKSGTEVLNALHRRRFGSAADEIVPLKGDGSDRLIYRLRSGRESCIGIIGASLDENRAFLGFTDSFFRAGLPVPEIYEIGADGLCYLEEDLGSETFATWQRSRRTTDAVAPEVIDMYREVLEILPRFQIDAADAVDYRLCYQHEVFATDAMVFDVRYFREMFLDRFFRGGIDETAFAADTGRLVERLTNASTDYFMYRDFQSRNIMIRDGRPVFIDYQSGRRGALQYDVASLLYDSSGKLPADIREQLLAAYLDEAGKRLGPLHEEFMKYYNGFAVLRLLQALGAFGKLGVLKRKTSFLALIPSHLDNLRSLVRQGGLPGETPYLKDLLLRVTDPEQLELPEECS